MSYQLKTRDGGLVECKKDYTVHHKADQINLSISHFSIRLTSFNISLSIGSQAEYLSATDFENRELIPYEEEIFELTEQEFTQYWKAKLPAGSLVRYDVSRKAKEDFSSTVSPILDVKVAYDKFLHMVEDLGVL